ncbi:MAG: PAS domain S-box protein, partial [bacterium]|nr:PAS domain S-box protein [bacterium]
MIKSKEKFHSSRHSQFFFRTPLFWQIVMTIGVVLTLFYFLINTHRLAAKYDPFVEASAKLQLELALGHLWFEEYLLGDPETDVLTTYNHFEKAEQYAEEMRLLENSGDSVLLFIKDDILQDEVHKIFLSLQTLRALITQRLEIRQSSEINFEIDQEFDEIFDQVLFQTALVETAINKARSKDLKEFQIMQGAMIGLVLGISLLAGLVQRRYDNNQASLNLALSLSEHKTKTIFNVLNDAVFLHPLLEEGFAPFVEVNQTACDVYGYTKEEFSTLTALNISKKSNAAKHAKAEHRKILFDQGTHIFESIHKTKCGEHFPVEINSTVIFLDGIPMILAAVRNISERKASEKLLSESIENYEMLFEEAPIPLWIEDFSEVLEYFAELKESGVEDMAAYLETNDEAVAFCYKKIKVVRVNKSSVALHEASSQDELLSQLDKIFTKKYFSVFKQELIALAKGETTFESKAEVKTLKGETKNIFLKLIISPRSLGTGIALMATFDTTEIVRLEDQFRQAQKMESVGLLAGGVAHDFNNMLAVILGNAELAMALVSKDDPIQDLLEGIENAGQRSADFTRQLLAFARKQTISPRVLNFDEAIGQTLEMLKRLIGENIELQWLPNANSEKIKMDPAQIDQVLTNLCVNSRDAIESTGTVIIETSVVDFDEDYCQNHPEYRQGQYIQLSFSDDGVGMEPDVLARIFEPFFSTKPSSEGSGLGMSTVYGIIKQNGGNINIYSERGLGTTTKVYLPLYLGDMPEVEVVE